MVEVQKSLTPTVYNSLISSDTVNEFSSKCYYDFGHSYEKLLKIVFYHFIMVAVQSQINFISMARLPISYSFKLGRKYSQLPLSSDSI